jgi:hypothetical protein
MLMVDHGLMEVDVRSTKSQSESIDFLVPSNPFGCFPSIHRAARKAGARLEGEIF